MQLTNIDLRLLRVFRAVVDAGGFAQAATVLNVGASTISTQMAELERRLQFRLCERGRAGFALTEQGAQAIAVTRRLFRELDDCAASLSAIKGQITGVLNMCFVDTFTSASGFDIANVVHEFSTVAPEAALDLQVLPETDLINGILCGRFHIGISSSQPAKAGLDHTPFLEGKWNVYCGLQHALATVDQTTLTREAIESHRFVGNRLAASEDGMIKRLEPGDARGSNLQMAAHLILSGHYLGFLPTHFARTWVARDEMIALRPDLFSTKEEFSIVTRSAGRATPAQEAFLTLLLRLRDTRRPMDEGLTPTRSHTDNHSGRRAADRLHPRAA